jgi:hypothetical protein
LHPPTQGAPRVQAPVRRRVNEERTTASRHSQLDPASRLSFAELRKRAPFPAPSFHSPFAALGDGAFFCPRSFDRLVTSIGVKPAKESSTSPSRNGRLIDRTKDVEYLWYHSHSTRSRSGIVPSNTDATSRTTRSSTKLFGKISNAFSPMLENCARPSPTLSRANSAPIWPAES